MSEAVDTQVPSPCVGVCRLDSEDVYCTGCMRTLTEIRVWPRLDAKGRREVLDRIRALADECPLLGGPSG